MDIQDAFLLEQAANPGSDLFKELKALLITEAGGDDPKKVLRASDKQWCTKVPFRGWPAQMEQVKMRYPSVDFSEKGVFVDACSAKVSVLLSIIDSINIASKAKRFTRSACFSSMADEISYIIGTSKESPFDVYDGSSVSAAFCESPYETAFMDHTSITVPVDRWLNVCYSRGVKIVEGCFYYHPAAERGWDSKFGWNELSVLHNGRDINIGPESSPRDRLTYTVGEYRTFLDPGCWIGDSSKYHYELFDYTDNIARYRAVYVGAMSPEEFRFNVPMCSDRDNILVTINSRFLDNSFAPDNKYFDSVLDMDKRDRAIEVRRNVVETCVAYLMTLSQGTDIVNAAIRHVSARNYIDLVEGSKLYRKPALNYSDALAVALVCALVAYQLRYSLTFESANIIKQAVSVSTHTVDSTTGLFGQILFYITNSIKQGVYKSVNVPIQQLRDRLAVADHIPGLIFDVYMERTYSVGTIYSPVDTIEPRFAFLDDFPTVSSDDPFVSFISGDVKASAPELDVGAASANMRAVDLFSELEEHTPRPLTNPVEALQEVYDTVLPGNSVIDVPNVSQQRRTNDININTSFVGAVKRNQDVISNEHLFQQQNLRTAAIPQTSTTLADIMIASSKRNWNKPDIQIVSDVYDMAEKLVDEFIVNAMIPGATEVLASKECDPTSFNTLDYCDWLSTRSESFRKSLLSSCPEGILSLDLEKYHTILKTRIKQKQTMSAQHELPSGQVIVHHDPSTNALFSSVFRQAFNTFDTLLKPTFKSAGRVSDLELSRWLTSISSYILKCPIVELDSSKYDKSQGLLAQAIEAVMCRRCGVDAQVLETFSESYVGNVASRNLGLAFIIAFQRKSGAADTMLGNLIYNYVSAGRSVGYSNISFMCGKGDDNIIGLVPGSDISLVTAKMASIFNIDAKVIEGKIVMFSSGYVVPLDSGPVLFCSDPIKRLELLGEINTLGRDGGKLSEEERLERFTSFADSISTYSVKGVPRLLAECVRRRTGVSEADVELAIDALIHVSRDYAAYCAVTPN